MLFRSDGTANLARRSEPGTMIRRWAFKRCSRRGVRGHRANCKGGLADPKTDGRDDLEGCKSPKRERKSAGRIGSAGLNGRQRVLSADRPPPFGREDGSSGPNGSARQASMTAKRQTRSIDLIEVIRQRIALMGERKVGASGRPRSEVNG